MSNLRNIIANLIFLDKVAKMSSLYIHTPRSYTFEAASAVDGIYKLGNELSSLAHSKRENRPWWRVDLGNVHCVWAVNILNRYTSKSTCLSVGLLFLGKLECCIDHQRLNERMT